MQQRLLTKAKKKNFFKRVVQLTKQWVLKKRKKREKMQIINISNDRVDEYRQNRV